MTETEKWCACGARPLDECALAERDCQRVLAACRARALKLGTDPATAVEDYRREIEVGHGHRAPAPLKKRRK